MNLFKKFLPKSGQSALAVNEDDAPLPPLVLEFQSPTAAVINLPLPSVARSSSYIIGLMVLTMIVVAGAMDVTKLVVASGVLSATTPNVSVQAFNASSIVRDIKVHPGEMVKKGQILATLDSTYTSADLKSLTQQEQNYAAQVAQLEAQENDTPYTPNPANPASALMLQTYTQQMGQYHASLENYDQQINQLQTQIKGYNEQAAYYRQRLSIATNVANMREKLQHLQVGSLLETEAAVNDRVSVQAQLASSISQAQAGERQLASIQAQRISFAQQFKAQTSMDLAKALNDLSQAKQQLAKAQLNNDLVELQAPENAIVQTVAPVSIGSVLQAGQDLMTLAPVDSPFIVRAEVSADESGFVHPGDQVTILLNTLNPLQYGSIKGTVVSVSPDSINPQSQQAQINTPLPNTPRVLYYEARISLDVMNLHNVPKGFRLVPGMPLQANIVVGNHSILSYFFAQLAPIAYESMHEP